MSDKTSYEITWGAVWKVLVLIGVAWLIYLTFDVLLAILVALVIAAGLDAPVSWLKKKGVPRLLSTLTLFILGVLAFATIIYVIVPLAISDFTQLANNLKEQTGSLFGTFEVSDLFSSLTVYLNSLADSLISGSLPITQVAVSLFGNIILVFTVLVLAFYLTVGQDGVERFLIAVLPATYEDKAIGLYLKTRGKIGQWLKGQVLLSLIIGFSVFIGLSFLGVKYALLLGILAGLFEIVPFVGPIFSGAIAILVALSSSLMLAGYTLILFVVIQQLENGLLVPLVMNYTTKIDPAVLLISLLIGGKAFGFVGLVLSVPVAVFFQELVEVWTTSKKKRKGLI